MIRKIATRDAQMLAGLGTLSTKSPRNERLLYDFYHRMQSRSVLFARANLMRPSLTQAEAANERGTM